MKKKSNIKILKDIQNDGSYTFVMDLDLSPNNKLQGTLNNKKAEDNIESTTKII